jgi:hypothetical protein
LIFLGIEITLLQQIQDQQFWLRIHKKKTIFKNLKEIFTKSSAFSSLIFLSLLYKSITLFILKIMLHKCLKIFAFIAVCDVIG